MLRPPLLSGANNSSRHCSNPRLCLSIILRSNEELMRRSAAEASGTAPERVTNPPVSLVENVPIGARDQKRNANSSRERLQSEQSRTIKTKERKYVCRKYRAKGVEPAVGEKERKEATTERGQRGSC